MWEGREEGRKEGRKNKLSLSGFKNVTIRAEQKKIEKKKF